MQTPSKNKKSCYHSIVQVIEQSKLKAVHSINRAMVEAYWQIGRLIVEEEQSGAERATYGKQLIDKLAKKLTSDFGQNFNARNLRYMRSFFLTFPNWNAVRSELNWTHYRQLLSVSNEQARTFYMEECIVNHWSTRELRRQISSLFYERCLSANCTKPQVQLRPNTSPTPEEMIKDPYVLEFLDLQPNATFLEQDLETALLNRLQQFLMELGKGFAFVARQKRINTATGKNFYIDLVFYHFILKCFILIDLKVGELTHGDIGQMDMYVRLYEDKWRQPEDNPTLGLILCSEKDQTIIKYSVLKESQQLFASRYQLYLPTEAELTNLITKDLEQIEMLKKDRV